MKEIIKEQIRFKHIPPQGINYWFDETDLIEPIDGRRQGENGLVREIPIFTASPNPFPEED